MIANNIFNLKHISFASILVVVSLLNFSSAHAVRLNESEIVKPESEATEPANEKKADENAPPRQVTLAVFDFNDSMQSPGIGRAVADMIIGSLAEDELIRIFERSRLKEIMEENKRSHPSDVEGSAMRAAGGMGVQFALLGKVSEFGISENGVLIPGQGTVTKYKARATLDVRLVDVSDASVIKTWTVTGTQTSYNLGVNILGIPNFSYKGRQFEESLLGKATRKAVENASGMIRADVRGPKVQSLAKEFKLSGRVADVEGNDLILNIGSLAGVKTGQGMGIYRVTKEVRDPDTDEVLTEKRERIGRLLVLHVEPKYCEAKVLRLEPGAEVQVGDKVVAEAPDESDNPD